MISHSMPHHFGQRIDYRTLHIGEHDVFVVSAGPTEAPAFVLVHGIGVSHRYFMPLVRELGKKFRVIALDLPGFGRSSRPAEMLTIADFAAVVGELIEKEQLVNPVLVGHSMGCQIVSELVRQQPDLATHIILMGPTVNARKPSALGHFWRLLKDSTGESWAVNKIVFSDYMHAGMWRYLQTAGPMFADRIEDRLPACPARVLVMRGARDPIATHDWAVMAARLAPHGELAEIPGGTHVIQYNQPKEVAAVCSRFAGYD